LHRLAQQSCRRKRNNGDLISMSVTRNMSTDNLPAAVGKLDRRTKKWRQLHETYTALVAHCLRAAERYPVITELLRTKERLAADTNHDDYVRLSNSYARLLRQLGPPAAAKEPSLHPISLRTANKASSRLTTARLPFASRILFHPFRYGPMLRPARRVALHQFRRRFGEDRSPHDSHMPVTKAAVVSDNRIYLTRIELECPDARTGILSAPLPGNALSPNANSTPLTGLTIHARDPDRRTLPRPSTARYPSSADLYP
jgi:hypothetical protein